ncbi:hypothetical protein Tco_0997062 [Tanacetum coccineum]
MLPKSVFSSQSKPFTSSSSFKPRTFYSQVFKVSIVFVVSNTKVRNLSSCCEVTLNTWISSTCSLATLVFKIFYSTLTSGFSDCGFTSSGTIAILGRSSYARVMVELKADVELKDNIVVAMPKITREGYYTCAGEKKTVKKPCQTSRGVLVGPKMGFKPQKEYRPVTKKLTASSSGNKKKGVEPTIECASNTPIGTKINKIERQIGRGKLRLLDNDGNPLVPTGIVESDSEVELVFPETANLRIPTSGKDESDKGYDTNSLLEHWRDSYPDNDDYDPYDDDMYENHDLSKHLQSICDDLDITVRGRKKK